MEKAEEGFLQTKKRMIECKVSIRNKELDNDGGVLEIH